MIMTGKGQMGRCVAQITKHLLTGAFFMGMAASAFAQDAPQAACLKLTDNNARFNCYDKLFGYLPDKTDEPVES